MKKKILLFIVAFCFMFSLKVISADAAEAMDVPDSIPVESIVLETAETLNTDGADETATIEEDVELIELDKAVVLTDLQYTSEGVELTWENYVAPEDLELLGYLVYRYKYDFEKMDFEEDFEMFATEANETVLLDTSTEPCNIYSYIVVAVMANQGELDNPTHISDPGNKEESCIGLAYTIGTPELELSNTADSIKLSWNAIPNADGYEIYKRKVGEDWPEKRSELIDDGSITSFEDKSFTKGTGYYYCIRAFFNDPANDGYYWANAFSAAKYIKRLSRPTVTVANAKDGVKVSWAEIAGANEYTVYRDGVELATTKSKEYIDKTAVDGTKYTYTVKATYKGPNSLSYSAESIEKSITFTPLKTNAPELTVSNLASSIKLSWTKVDGANGYYIYRRTASGKWSTKPYKTITSGSTLSYSDTSFTNGTGYYYKISYYKTKSGKKTEGDCSEASYIKRMARPSISTSYDASCIKVSWKKIAGATGYTVYRGGKEIGTTTDLFFKDYNIVDGVEYSYTVKAYYQGSSDKFYSAASAKKRIFGLILKVDAPELKVSNAASHISLSWNEIDNADGYCIYRRTASGKWSTTPYAIIEDKDITSYKNTNFTKGAGYYYKVTAYLTQSSARIESEFSNTEYIRRMSRPSITASYGASCIKLSWADIAGATGYVVYRNGIEIGTTEDKYYKDYTIVEGVDYSYTVKAYYQGANEKFYSAASIKKEIEGKILTVNAPELKVLNYINDIRLSWTEIADADGYCIYRRKGSGSWSNTPFAIITDGNITSYKDKNFTNGTSYYYKVTAYLKPSKDRIESEFSNTEYIKRMSRPSVTVSNKGDTNGSSYIKLTWGKIAGADGYAVYRNDELLETVTTTTYLDYSVGSGNKYEYKVRAYYQGASKVFYSAYSAVDTIYHLSVPGIESLTGGNGKFSVKLWSLGLNNVTGFQIKYSRNKDMSNSKTYTASGSSATVTGLSANKTYYVQVRLYKTVNGIKYYGAYTSTRKVTS